MVMRCLKRGQSRVKVSYSPPSPQTFSPYFSCIFNRCGWMSRKDFPRCRSGTRPKEATYNKCLLINLLNLLPSLRRSTNLNNYGINLTIDHFLDQFSLISPPEVGQRHQIQTATDILHPDPLIIGEYRSYGDCLDLQFPLQITNNWEDKQFCLQRKNVLIDNKYHHGNSVVFLFILLRNRMRFIRGQWFWLLRFVPIFLYIYFLLIIYIYKNIYLNWNWNESNCIDCNDWLMIDF